VQLFCWWIVNKGLNSVPQQVMLMYARGRERLREHIWIQVVDIFQIDSLSFYAHTLDLCLPAIQAYCSQLVRFGQYQDLCSSRDRAMGEVNVEKKLLVLNCEISTCRASSSWI